MAFATRMTAVMACCAALFAAPGALADDKDEIRLQCGGVGLDESEALRASAGRHALMIIFATPDRAYLSGVQTRIDDPLADRVAEAECGPIGLVDVPTAGRYRLTTSFRGESRSQWFDLEPGGGARTVVQWAE